MESKIYKQCQSCGMPLQGREGDMRGSEVDGSPSNTYCKLCYQGGSFYRPDLTLDEMKTVIEKAMKEKGMNWLIRKLAIMQLPHLKRWKS